MPAAYSETGRVCLLEAFEARNQRTARIVLLMLPEGAADRPSSAARPNMHQPMLRRDPEQNLKIRHRLERSHNCNGVAGGRSAREGYVAGDGLRTHPSHSTYVRQTHRADLLLAEKDGSDSQRIRTGIARSVAPRRDLAVSRSAWRPFEAATASMMRMKRPRLAAVGSDRDGAEGVRKARVRTKSGLVMADLPSRRSQNPGRFLSTAVRRRMG